MLFFYKLPRTLKRIFSGRNLLWQLIAILLTFLLVHFNFDYTYYLAGQATGLQPFAFPAIIAGSLLPILLPLVLLIIGLIRKSFRIKNTAYAVGQAAILGSVISSIYKVFTGRPGPNRGTLLSSHQFNFGFLRGGIFWGWPSSHTTIAFAMGITLFILFRKNILAKYASLAYALYIGLAVSFTIHWFSDFVAGAIIGSIIGLTVGYSFLERSSSL